MQLHPMRRNEVRNYSIAASAMVLLAVLALAHTWGVGPLVDRMAEEGRRRARYEKAIVEKGLSLHRGAFWKEKH